MLFNTRLHHYKLAVNILAKLISVEGTGWIFTMLHP